MRERANNEMRAVKITRNFTRYAEGSVLVEFGNTKVLCNASVENKVPPFLRGKEQGWVTAEYSMLPRATHDRSRREATAGKQSARSVEIQRLIGRSLRSMVDLNLLKDYTITVDCDVLQADGGTRTASITGAAVALNDAVNSLLAQKLLTENPLKGLVSAISVGIVEGEICCDLDYSEDSNAETDMNLVFFEGEQLIEIQGTAEKKPFSEEQLFNMVSLARKSCEELLKIQHVALLND